MNDLFSIHAADETRIVVYVQAALCASTISVKGVVVDDEKSMLLHVAKEYASIALQNHDLLFGGGVKFFRQRYARELQLRLRPATGGWTFRSLTDTLWPLPKA